MGKNIKIVSISAIVLLYTLSFSSNVYAASFWELLTSREDSNSLLTASLRSSNPTMDDMLRTTFEKASMEEPEIRYSVARESFRQVTAYNVGDPYQNDSTPCIGAYAKVNLCDEVAKGVRVCAANFVPKQTMLRIFTKDGGSFECIVWDRMHSRFSSRVDIAMNYAEKTQARQFGLQVLKVQILAEATN